MNKDILVNRGKELSYILRHSKEDYDNGLIDEHGWMKISDLILLKGYSNELIDEIVKTNNKSRYEYNDDKTKIRARQGHSIPVDVELTETEPPAILYHGTSKNVVDKILNEGIKPQTRLYVHLSKDIDTAKTVGARHGKPAVLKVYADKMYKDGIKFYLSNNGVWLTKFVDKKYINHVFV